jgi:hypothetical protein
VLAHPIDAVLLKLASTCDVNAQQCRQTKMSQRWLLCRNAQLLGTIPGYGSFGLSIRCHCTRYVVLDKAVIASITTRTRHACMVNSRAQHATTLQVSVDVDVAATRAQ